MAKTKELTKTRGFKITLIAAILCVAILTTALLVIFLGDNGDYDDGFWLLTEDISKYISLTEDDYKKAVLTIDAVEEITDADVDKYIRDAQIKAYADKLVTHNTGTVQHEDTVVLWYRGEVNIGTEAEPNWVEFLGGSNYNDTAYALRLGSGNFIPGFEEALEGIVIENTNINIVKGANKRIGEAGNIAYITYKYTATDENGKTKTGSLAELLGGVKRLKNPGQFLRQDSAARVLDFQLDVFCIKGCSDGQNAIFIRHGMKTVEDQIQQRLGKLNFIGHNPLIPTVEIQFNLHIIGLGRIGNYQGFPYQLIQ